MKSKICFLLLTIALSGCISKDNSTNNNILNHNRQVATRYFEEVWNKGQLTLLDTLLSPQYINHTPSAPTTPGPAGLKPIVSAIRRAFPDLHYEMQEIITTPDFVTMRVIMTGTQKDSLFGIPPTGKRINVMQINIEKIVDGRIAEHWRVTDELAMMKQLEVVK